MKKRIRISLIFLAGLPAFAGEDISSPKGGLDPQRSSEDGIDLLSSLTHESEARWRLGMGVAGRQIGELDFDTARSRFQIPGIFGGHSFSPPPGIGPESGQVERIYDNGFVRPGPRTGATGRTTDYQYLTPDQIRGDHLLMTATGGEQRMVATSSQNSATAWSDGADWEISPYLSLSRLVDLGSGWHAGPSIHFSFTGLDGRRDGLRTLRATERRDIFEVRAFDRFDTAGLVLPRAPYTGSPGAIAPLLPAEPSDRRLENSLRSTDRAFFQDSVSESLDVNLFGFSLGGELFFEEEDGFFLGLGSGLVLNLADWDAQRSAQLFQVTNGGTASRIDATEVRESGTDLLFGAYFQGLVGFQVSDSISIEANARYDWNESLRDSVGESDFDLNLSGFTLGLGVNYSF